MISSLMLYQVLWRRRLDAYQGHCAHHCSGDRSFRIRHFYPNLNCSSHAQFGEVWKFIMKSSKAVSKYPFQSIRNVDELDLSDCGLKGERRRCTPSWLAFNIKAQACVPQSNRTSTIAWLVFCMFWLRFVYPQVPFRLDWAIWRIYSSCIYTVTSLPVITLSFPLTCIQYEGKGLLSLCPFTPVG
jgi:hypothetical protein